MPPAAPRLVRERPDGGDHSRRSGPIAAPQSSHEDEPTVRLRAQQLPPLGIARNTRRQGPLSVDDNGMP
ncbi:hypothetical protein ACWDF9_02685 [Streptomyces rubiginosohelvolus]